MDLRYPIGKFTYEGPLSENDRETMIDHIEQAPAHLKEAVSGLTEEQLDTAYRPDGWTVRQVVHHLADSHINSYVRFRLVLTEDSPTVKTYDEGLWAELIDAKTAPIEPSLALLESLHYRWVMLLRSLSSGDCARTFTHPEIGPVDLDKYIALYAWHGRHHVAHITTLRERMGW